MQNFTKELNNLKCIKIGKYLRNDGLVNRTLFLKDIF